MQYRDISQAVVGLSGAIDTHGHLIESRTGTTKEIIGSSVTITNPSKRHLTVENRRNNPIAAIVETMWVLSGNNDARIIKPYLPRALDFTDDGKHWRAGYGSRLGHHFGHDQIQKVFEILKNDPQSRQAVMVIHDPAVDHDAIGKSRDIPCNNWLAFIIREGKLHVSIAVRSNDLIWGFSGINQFEWSFLQEMLAEWLGVEVGPQYWLQSSLHIYERHFKLLPSGDDSIFVARGSADLEPLSSRVSVGIPTGEHREYATRFLAACKAMQDGEVLDHEFDTVLGSYLGVVQMYHLFQQEPSPLRDKVLKEFLAEFEEALGGTDLFQSVMMYFRQKGWVDLSISQ